VQLGLEGIVIVHPDVKYGALTDPRTDDDAAKKLFFKLKQKIVLPGRQITKLGNKEIHKDGELENQYEYTIMDENKQTIKFTDQQDRTDGSYGSYSRIKYMEFVPGDEEGEGFNRFPCTQGYRHMHFATNDDESVQVPACRNFHLDENIREVLAWDNSNNRILNWDQLQDLDQLDEIMLFNPKPFALREALLRKYPSPPSSPSSSTRRLKKRSKSGVFPRGPPVIDLCDSDSHDREDNALYAKKPQKETPYDVQHKLPEKADHSVPESEPWPAPKKEESEWIKKQWEFRSRPRKEDPEMLRRAYDAATLENLRSQDRRDQAQIDADKKIIGELETQIFEAEAQKQELETQISEQDAEIDEETRKNLYLQIAEIIKKETELERRKSIKQGEIESKRKAKQIALEILKERAAAQASNMYYIISSFRNI
jgi:hypothetical protein